MNGVNIYCLIGDNPAIVLSSYNLETVKELYGDRKGFWRFEERELNSIQNGMWIDSNENIELEDGEVIEDKGLMKLGKQLMRFIHWDKVLEMKGIDINIGINQVVIIHNSSTEIIKSEMEQMSLF